MNDLYREELMDIYKNPSHKGNITNPTVSINKENSMCGDSLTLELQVENNVVKDAKFNGNACAVSVISADLLLGDIIGKNMEDVKKIDKDYLLNLLDMNLTTSRIKCATLILNALRDALNKLDTPKQISKEDNLATVIREHPEVEEILYDYGLHCAGCALNAFDSIEAGAKIHSLSDEEIDEMTDRINEVISTGE